MKTRCTAGPRRQTSNTYIKSLLAICYFPLTTEQIQQIQELVPCGRTAMTFALETLVCRSPHRESRPAATEISDETKVSFIAWTILRELDALADMFTREERDRMWEEMVQVIRAKISREARRRVSTNLNPQDCVEPNSANPASTA